jgi:peptide deformylase
MILNDQNLGTLDLIDPTNALLNQAAEAIREDEIDSDFIQGVVSRMLDLAAGKGRSAKDSRQIVGLAAVQLGVSKRIISIDITADGSKKDQNLKVFINPVIVQCSSERIDGREGCWSCSNVCGNVQRSESVTLEGSDQEGQLVRVKLDGFVARIAQHEVDHLDGVRFPDRIPIDEPQRLHWVEHSEFDNYRQNWMNWRSLCSREQWEAIKSGSNPKAS